MKFEIIDKSREFSKKELYDLTRGDCVKVADLDDSFVIDVTDYIYYKTENATGEVVTLLSITDDTSVYTTISETFINEFFYIMELVESTKFKVGKKSGKSKNGRQFITCVLV